MTTAGPAPEGHGLPVSCGYLPISTCATRFTPLSASTSFPSAEAIMLRTTPPPEGITQVWNRSVAGSKKKT